MLLLTLRGTPTLYYGDEIGMRDVPIPPARVQDPWERNVPGLGLGRDPERTPMQWDASAGAGFTAGEPWLPLADDWRESNVAAQRDDPASMLALYRRLIALRRREPALSVGGYTPVEAVGDLLAYLRHDGVRRFLVVLNLGPGPAELEPGGLPDGGSLDGRIAISTSLGREGDPVRDAVEVRGAEGVVVELR
jgi:alpha-glucosidase